jgi:hypothetical protein
VNNLDDLKDAMHSPPDFDPRPLDLAGVMTAGSRMRMRRRLAIGSASALTVAALLVGGGLLARQDTGTVVAPAGPGVLAPQTHEGVLGELIDTGLLAGGAEQVIYGVPVEGVPRPDVDFGFMLGRRMPDGSLKGDVMINESEASAKAPGFRSPEAPMEVDGIPAPAFGYYVGPATKITVLADGREVTAQQAPWSRDASVVVFWFDPAQAKPDAELEKLTAYDKDGKKLPAGNNTFAVG